MSIDRVQIRHESFGGINRWGWMGMSVAANYLGDNSSPFPMLWSENKTADYFLVWYEWKWAYRVIQEYYGVDFETITAEKLMELVMKWKDSVVGLDNLIYDDARKEFSLSMMTSFGADGDEAQRKEDFMQVRGSFFESDPFVTSVKEHIRIKSALGEKVLELLKQI